MKKSAIFKICKGCSLGSVNHLCNEELNHDSSCPCINCLVKMMKCDSDPSMNKSCDKWMNWFSDRFFKYTGNTLDE